MTNLMPQKLNPLVLTLLLAGCQGKADLAGTVSYQGKPVVIGSVHALGSDGIIKAAVIKNGAYALQGLPAGAVQFTVTSPNPDSQRVVPRNPDQPAPQAPESAQWFALPEKYASFATADLIVNVQSGPNKIDLQLK